MRWPLPRFNLTASCFASAVLVLALSACGGDSANDPPPDASPTVDAGPNLNLVTVEVVSGIQPAVGIHIVFHDSTGALLDATVSGQDGIAQYELPAGGMVTVVPPSSSLSTFTNVQPGETLTFDVAPSGDPQGVAQVELTGSIGAANRYLVLTGCGSQTLTAPISSATFTIDTRCVNANSEMAVIAWAFEVDDADNFVTVHGFASIKNVAVTVPSTSVTVPAFQPLKDNLSLAVSNGQGAPRGQIGEVIDDIFFGRILALPSPNPFLFPVDTDVAESIEFDVTYNHPDVTTNGILTRPHFDYFRFANNDLVQSFDIANGLPPIESMSIDTTDPIRPSLSYTAPTSTADLWVASLTAPGLGWDMIAPADQRTVRLPELPSYLEERWMPVAAEIAAGAIVVDLSIVNGYDDARTGYGFSIYSSGTPPLGAPGSFVKAALGLYAPSSTAQPSRLRGWAGNSVP